MIKRLTLPLAIDVGQRMLWQLKLRFMLLPLEYVDQSA
jgi:hypothetical protein